MSINHWIIAKGIGSGYFIEGTLIAFLVTSIKPIRRYAWEIFMKAHWIIILAALASAIIHDVDAVFISIGIYILDICFR